MRKRVGIIKQVTCLGLVFLLSINSFAAIVSDNDGSAFITKSEFDALKSSFKSQIDTYNQSIDSKIDGAIASYLAGIKLSNETNEIFFDGSAGKLVVIDSGRNSLLKIPYGQLDWFEADGKFSSVTNNISQHCCGSVRIVRDDDSWLRGGDVFFLEDGEYNYYSPDWNYKMNINFTFNRAQTGSVTYPPKNAPDLYVRWWSYFGGKKSTVKNAHVDTLNNSSYATKPMYAQFIAWSTTYFWADAWAEFGGDNLKKYVASAISLDHGKVIWINDSSSTNASTKKMWLDVDSSNRNFLIENFDTRATNGWDTSGSNWKTDYPDQHGVDLDVLFTVNSGGTEPRSIATYTKGHWVGSGLYSTSTSTDPSTLRPSPTMTSMEWEEPLQKIISKDQTLIKNKNFTTAVLNNYAPFGFSGNIHQGMPLYLFEKDGRVEFELDTTGIGGDVIFALKTSPFDCTTTAIHNTPLTTGISNLKLDGAAVTGGDMTLSQGVHKISFDVTGASSTSKVPVFFMFGYPSLLTETPRYVVTLPSTFKFASMD